MLKDDLSRLYDALELSVAKLDDLNLQGVSLDSIDSAEMRHDIRNAIGITKGYAELIKDTAEAPSATLSNLLDKIMLWSAKTISTLERTRLKQTDSSLFAMTAIKQQHPDHRGHQARRQRPRHHLSGLRAALRPRPGAFRRDRRGRQQRA
ncbi:MAG: hypothetical protein QMB64_00860, partial [Pseudomonadales bacterium]